MNHTLPLELQQLINAEQAYHYRIVPSKKEGKRIVFKTDNENPSALQSKLFILLGWILILKRKHRKT